MAAPEVLGVSREQRFSPGKVEDDRAILEAVAEGLRSRGVAVRVLDGDRLPPAGEVDGRLVFAMCQSQQGLGWLDGLARRARVVNTPESIRNCYRSRMLRRLAASRVPHPLWVVAGDEFPRSLGPGPWLKRGDVHAMEAGDVRRVQSPEEWRSARAELARRGVEQAIAQAHIDGTVYKFYGVRGGFFRAFGLPPGLEEGAARLAAAGAEALGLEVYGGDGVVRPDGSLTLIDFNDWPSFSRCRDEAAAAITRHLSEILKTKP